MSPASFRVLLLTTLAFCFGAVPVSAKRSSTVTVGSITASGTRYPAGASLAAGAVVSTDARSPAEMITPSAATLRLGRSTSASVGKGKAKLFRGSVLLSSASGILGRRSEDVVAGAAKIACNVD